MDSANEKSLRTTGLLDIKIEIKVLKTRFQTHFSLYLYTLFKLHVWHNKHVAS